MGSALVRGRALDPFAVDKANQWRIARLKELGERNILTLAFKERHELQRLKSWAKKHRVWEGLGENT